MLVDVQALVDRMADDHTAMGHRVIGSRWPGRHHPCMCGPWRCDAVWTTGWALPFATAVALKSPCVTLPML